MFLRVEREIDVDFNRLESLNLARGRVGLRGFAN